MKKAVTIKEAKHKSTVSLTSAILRVAILLQSDKNTPQKYVEIVVHLIFSISGGGELHRNLSERIQDGNQLGYDFALIFVYFRFLFSIFPPLQKQLIEFNLNGVHNSLNDSPQNH